jgi:cell division protein FtsL
MSGDTRVLSGYNYGSAASTRDAAAEAGTKRIETPPAKRAGAKERVRRLEQASAAMSKKVPGISVFAVFGAIVIAVMMVFVVLAQINYNESASESVKLSTQVRELSEKYRVLELAFESSIDIREVERYARDELGMSRPDASQIIVINTTPRDSATVIHNEDSSGIQGFGEFLRSLTDYFRN